ncbi:unnamed protein product [Effrenium voratum]|nr:unnamed protein product [Effrenium voratum]
MGVAEMNGWRPSMEDAHVAFMQDSWGFFGVFDGHGGQQCSSFVARRLTEELKAMKAVPPDDASVKSLMLRIDAEFLEAKQPSGSTGTFAFVVPEGEKIQLRACPQRRSGAPRGRPVVATDRVVPHAAVSAPWGEKVEFVQADLCDAEAMQKLAARTSSVVHVGAIPGPSSFPPPGVEEELVAKHATIGLEPLPGLELLRQNFLGTCALFEAALKAGHTRVVFSSSLFAMGWSHDPRAFRPHALPLEEAQAAPLEHYGLSKLCGEEFAAMLTRADSGEAPSKRARMAPSFVSLRFSNIIKAEKWQELPLALPKHSITPLMWAYCHEHDVVEAHLKALALPSDALASRCESFIIAADDTRYDVPTAELIEQHFGAGFKPPAVQPMEGFASIVCNQKARRVLGLRFRSFRTPEAAAGTASGAGRIFGADLELKSGRCAHLKLVYQTYGLLNAEKSNCILHPTSYDATHPELEYNVGPGKLLDTDKYFVVIVNLLGNGFSSSPGCAEYPADGTSMCDNVRLQALLLDSLGISEIACIYGYSMGAMQALHWAAMFPERVKRVAAVCGSASVSDYNLVFLNSLEAALLADSDVQEGQLQGSGRRGLKAFARIYAGWGVSREFYQQELWRTSSRDGKAFTSLEDFVSRSYDQGFATATPLHLLAQLRTWRTGDIRQARGLPGTLASVLGRITARVYLMPCITDSYFCAADIEAEAKLMASCRYLPIQSCWGHRAGDPHRPGQQADAEFLRRCVHELLAEVGNIGDSRVLLGRADGTMVEGSGTDGGLTTDHKPDNEVEAARIKRTGGTVQAIMGVARVNGDLAVSRAFGDAQHKQTGGPGQEDHPVSVEPEFATLSCDRSDFLMLVCDGISEGNFPNREVVQLAAKELKTKEPAQAAASVCRRALESGSMDNLSCMIVCFDGKGAGHKKELLPGPFTEPTHGAFRKAYAGMAERAGLTLEAAVEQRYNLVRKMEQETNHKENGDAKPKEDKENGQEEKGPGLELRRELRVFDGGPPEKLEGEERTRWFKEWQHGGAPNPGPQLHDARGAFELGRRRSQPFGDGAGAGLSGPPCPAPCPGGHGGEAATRH